MAAKRKWKWLVFVRDSSNPRCDGYGCVRLWPVYESEAEAAAAAEYHSGERRNGEAHVYRDTGFRCRRIREFRHGKEVVPMSGRSGEDD